MYIVDNKRKNIPLRVKLKQLILDMHRPLWHVGLGATYKSTESDF